MNQKKKYHSVSQMVREVSEEETFADNFEKRLKQRQIVKLLFALRSAQGLSQQDIAEKMNCSQSRISKLENGCDNDLSLQDVDEYTEALGLETTIVLAKKGRTIVDDVKYHALAMKEKLAELAQMAGDDSAIAEGILRFYGETAFNLALMLKEVSEKLPLKTQVPPPFILVELDEDPESESSSKHKILRK